MPPFFSFLYQRTKQKNDTHSHSGTATGTSFGRIIPYLAKQHKLIAVAPLKKAYLAINDSQTGLQAMFNRDCQRMLHFRDWTDEDIRSIQAPALILIGNEDVTKPGHAVAMSRLLPKGKWVILPGGHGECLGEVSFEHPGNLPSITAGLVEDFLK